MVRRIVFFAPQLSTGGSERQLLLLAHGLRQRGWDVGVWCQAGGPKSTEVGRGLESSGVCVTHASQRPGLPSAFRMTEFLRYLRRSRPDIVHSFGYGGHWMDAVVARLAGVPYVDSRRNIRHWDDAKRLQPGERIRNGISRMTIANCVAVAEVVRRVEMRPAERLTTIHNGVQDMDHLRPSGLRNELPADAIVVGNLANLKSVKGHDILLRSFARASYDNPRLHLMLAGTGEFRAALDPLVRSLGIKDRVRCVGQQAPTHFLSAIDVYAHASRAEGFPNSILEAMVCAKPVIASAVGGVPEAVEHGVTGILVEAEAEDELASAMSRLGADEDLRRRMGVAGRRRALMEFPVSRMVEKHEELYEQIRLGR